MRKIFFAIFFLFAISATAQRKDSVIEKFVTVYYGLSFNNTNFKNLNNKLSNYSNLYNKPAQNYFGAHFGFSNISSKLISNFDISIASARNGDASKKSTKSTLLDVSYNVGFIVYKTNRFMFAPSVGLGINSSSIVLNKNISNVSIDSILTSANAQQNSEPIKFANGFAYYKLGASFYLLDKKNHHPMVEFNLGYLASLKDSYWKVNQEQTIANAPKDKLGLYQIAMLLYFKQSRGKGKNTVKN